MNLRTGALTVLLATTTSACSCNGQSGILGPPIGPQDAATADGRTDAEALDSPVRDVEGNGQDVYATDVIVPDAPARDAAPDATGFDAEPYDGTLCEAPPPPPGSMCPASLCGNGIVDTCQMCQPCGGGFLPDGGRGGPPPLFCDGGMTCTQSSEQCDGTNLNGASCAQLHYAGGALGCGRSCAFDTSDCTTCKSDPHLVSCAEPHLDVDQPVSLAMAVSGDSIGVAWISTAQTQTGSARFAIFDGALSLQREIPCMMRAGARSVALASVAGGWILAVEFADGTVIQTIDTALRQGPARMMPGAVSPQFASRPNDGPLLVFSERSSTGTMVSAAFLDAMGQETLRVGPLFGAVVEEQYGSAVAVDNGFLVAMRDRNGVSVRSIGADGTLGAAMMPGSSSTEYPQLAFDGTNVSLTWADFGATPRVLWARLTTTGALAAPAVQIGAVPNVYDPVPIVGRGGDTIAFMGGYTGGTGRISHADVARLDGTGAFAVGPININQDPNDAFDYRIALFGTDAVVAWITTGNPGRIVLARVAL